MRQVTLGTFNPSPYAKQLVNQVLETGRISYGPMSKEFERKFSALHGCRYGVLSNSGTSSLLVALQTLKELHGWKDGARVVVPAVTFVATVNIVLQARLKPVLVDIEPEYYGLDIDKVDEQANIFNQIKCIIPVHTFGQPCDIGKLYQYLNSFIKPVRVIEDSCESMFVNHQNRPVGSWGDIGCFSFYVAHLLTTGVGGMATTNNPDYARKMRSLVNHGLAYDDLSSSDDYDPSMLARKFRFDSVGHSFRITELEAALGLAALEDWQKLIVNRHTNAAYLTDTLVVEGLGEFLQLPQIRPRTEHAFMMYPLVCKQPGVRDRLMCYLKDNGIESRTMLPLVSQPVYKGLWNPDDYPVARWIDDNGFYCGIHQDLSYDDLDYVADKLREFFR